MKTRRKKQRKIAKSVKVKEVKLKKFDITNPESVVAWKSALDRKVFGKRGLTEDDVKVYSQILVKLIEEGHLVFLDDCVAECGFGRTTFNQYKFNEQANITEALVNQKTVMKKGLRAKMFNSDNPSGWIALYRLLATKEELDALSQNKNMIGNADGTPIKLVLGEEEDD